MAKQPRIYLFHGNDSRASSRALQAWERKFREKYGSATRYVLDADEQTPELLTRQLGEVLGMQGLFPEPKLIIIKRLTHSDRGTSQPHVKAFIQAMTDLVRAIDANVTLVVWEEKRLTDRHALHVWFAEHADLELAKVNAYDVLGGWQALDEAERYLRERGYSLSKEGRTWLYEQLQWLEKAARNAKRLRAADQLAQDERSWWMAHTLDMAMMHAQGVQISVRDLEMGAGQQGAPVSIFECINALRAKRYEEARKLVTAWSQQADESAYFSFYSLLRREFSVQKLAYGLRLLADIELIAKNTTLSGAWLIDMLILRLWQADRQGIQSPIIEPRQLWLSQLPRS